MLTQRSKEAADKVSLQKAESMLGTYLRVDDDRLEDYLWRIGDNKRIASVNSYRGRIPMDENVPGRYLRGSAQSLVMYRLASKDEQDGRSINYC